MKNRMRGQGGFSLIELTTAMFVLAIGIMGTLQMYSVGAQKMRTIRENEIASRAVEAEIETLRALPFSQLADRKDAPFVSASAGLDSLARPVEALTVSAHSDARLKLKEVTATIRWTGENARTLQKSVTAYIADKGAL